MQFLVQQNAPTNINYIDLIVFTDRIVYAWYNLLCYFKYYVTFHFRFFIFWSRSCASWIITLMSIERFMAIYFPIRTKTLRSKTKIIAIMAVTGILLAALSLHFFWTYEINQGRTSQYCGSISKYSAFLRDHWPWINLASYSLIPTTILICTSMSIIMKIIHSNYVRKHKMDQKEGGVKMTSITLTLLTVSTVFVATTGPVVVYR